VHKINLIYAKEEAVNYGALLQAVQSGINLDEKTKKEFVQIIIFFLQTSIIIYVSVISFAPSCRKLSTHNLTKSNNSILYVDVEVIL
jgi:hypothetical protein